MQRSPPPPPPQEPAPSALSVAAMATMWWGALTGQATAAPLVLGRDAAGRPLPAGIIRRMTFAVVAMYAAYGFAMGLYRGWWPAVVSAAKLPVLYVGTLAICLPALFVLNSIAGPRLSLRHTARLLMVATSANAAALVSYVPFALFFTFTTPRDGYTSMVVMHLVAFFAATTVSVVVVTLLFSSTAAAIGRRLRVTFVLGWSLLYALVITQLSWALRPWIGSWSSEYTAFRPRGGTFVEAVFSHLQRLF